MAHHLNSIRPVNCSTSGIGSKKVNTEVMVERTKVSNVVNLNAVDIDYSHMTI